MTKKSRPCAYMGRMHIMNRENIGKRVFDTERSKVSLQLEHEHSVDHVKKSEGIEYPEAQRHECSCKKCGCKQ